jgi:hypothetical protein
MSEEIKKEKVCCPQFEPALWDGKILDWNNKRFVKAKVFTFLYMPINFGGVMKRLCNLMDKAGAQMTDGLLLADHTSKWNMNLYLATDKEISGIENVMLNGKFLCKVYEGNFKDTGKWVKDFQDYLKNINLNSKKLYMWYTTCPKCAKKYGKNYVAIVGQIE